MAAPNEGTFDVNSPLKNLSLKKMCEIEATVVSGFESMAKEEIEEKLGAEVVATSRGRVHFLIPFEIIDKILSLRSVDNLLLVLDRFDQFEISDDVTKAMEQIKSIVPKVDWDSGVKGWSRFFEFPHPISVVPIMDIPSSSKSTVAGASASKLEECSDENSIDPPASTTKEDVSRLNECSNENVIDLPSSPIKTQKMKNPLLPSYRVTCNRSGDSHCFQSPMAAAQFGGAINDHFGWNVDLENFDLEVVLNINDNNVRVCVALTKESLHRRDIVKFGATTLRPTIAYGMLRMCKINSGETVCDPMCGGGSIPIEAAISFPDADHICGDIDEHSTNRCKINLEALNKKRSSRGLGNVNVDTLRWDACSLPLKDNSVDVFITDLPFGKRVGSRLSNWHLYPRVLTELARVSRNETGRACVLTHDRKCIIKSMNLVSHLWKRGPTIAINIGGLAAGVYLLHRTSSVAGSAPE